MEKEEDNILVFKEKPYYTDDELKLYYQIAIAEFAKSGNEVMANHYRILLKMLENKNQKQDPLVEKIINYNKNKNKK